MMKYQSQEEAIRALKNGQPFSDQDFDQWRDNTEVVIEAIEQQPSALKDASQRLRNDPDLVLIAMEDDANAFTYAAQELQNLYRTVSEKAEKEQGKQPTPAEFLEAITFDPNQTEAKINEKALEYNTRQMQDVLNEVNQRLKNIAETSEHRLSEPKPWDQEQPHGAEKRNRDSIAK